MASKEYPVVEAAVVAVRHAHAECVSTAVSVGLAGGLHAGADLFAALTDETSSAVGVDGLY